MSFVGLIGKIPSIYSFFVLGYIFGLVSYHIREYLEYFANGMLMCVNVSASAWAISSNKMRDKRKVVDTMPTKSTSTNYSSII